MKVMKSDDATFVLRTLGFSALAGMRSMSPPALLSLYLERHHTSPGHPVAERIRSKPVVVSLVTMALGEITADKFPQPPDRVFAPAMVFRLLTGGGVSALLWSLNKRPAWIGALLGAAVAIVNTYVTFNIRLWLGRTLPIPNALSWSGLIEDAIVWLGGWWLLNGTNKRDNL